MAAPKSRWCSVIRADVPTECPARHRIHGCACAEEMAERAAIVGHDRADKSTHLPRAEADAVALEMQRARVIRKPVEQRRLFG